MTGELDQDLVEEGLALLKKKLGDDVYGQITIVSQSHILFLMDIVHHLEGAYNAKGVRNWFKRQRETLDNQAPIDFMQKEWDVDDPMLVQVRKLAESLEDMNVS